MSKTLADLVSEFNKLSQDERTRFRDLIVHSSEQTELYGEITDDDIEAMARDSFQRLDKEENAAETRRSVAS